MKSLPLFVLSLAAAFLSVTATLHADNWLPPSPRIYASAWGNHGFKLLPKFGGPGQGVLFQLDKEGKEILLWQKKLVNTPHQVFVANDGQVVTIDTYGKLGYAHVLVLYEDKGNVVKDYALEDLLTPDELNTKVLYSASSRMWADKAKFAFEGNYFVVHFSWGRTLYVNRQTGKLGK